ncbi:pyridoxal-dependent decarboxylase [Desulfosporosinus sp. PR]|uniref:pyridoxal phosphate-dependent decarboxylase family protein n=1 Tax=Candidatus Desulfosporosinus nitrosoreducens TaxID=3401928 RepID=UPI0027E86DBE|nr:pyridoxal-dependent decarboxylase [Desulfosporosinus sp. PR]MDQ7092078.1 pyridoxal-dependent decarboxylase [Desulfosporosinus sp. PR]
MKFDGLKEQMSGQLKSKELFEQAKSAAYEYLDSLPAKTIVPSDQAIAALDVFQEPMPAEPSAPREILELLSRFGSEATVAQSGGKYFGFVCGGYYPVSAAAKWIADLWDQNGALFVMSPITSKLEEVCEQWLVDLLGLPSGTAAGFVSGSSLAILCALAAARNELLLKQGWDVNQDGLFGAPPLRVVVGEQAHSTVFKALSLLGLGRSRVELVPADDQGRMIAEKLPPLDSSTLLIAQAGNVNSGAFDPLEALCGAAKEAGAWIHVDGAFGLWAAASPHKYPLLKGFEKADSWSVDAHKTLNAPYDCGIVLCRKRSALVNAMRASASYIQYSPHRDGMMYTPEMSRRSRSIELWATLKCLGKKGVGALVDELCENAGYFAERLAAKGFSVVNDVVFNQVLVKCETAELTNATLRNIQASGNCWCGGAQWQGEPVIRISVCSWQTSRQDLDECVETFVKSRSV